MQVSFGGARGGGCFPHGWGWGHHPGGPGHCGVGDQVQVPPRAGFSKQGTKCPLENRGAHRAGHGSLPGGQRGHTRLSV